MSEPIVACQDVVKVYRDGQRDIEVLRGISLSILPGERIGIVGRSGSGKTTLLNCLAGLDKPTSGQVQLNGHSFSKLRARAMDKLRANDMGFVFQFHFLLWDFSAQENIAMPLRLAGATRAHSMARAAVQCDLVGLGQRMTHKVGQLSGGERQRVAIARALVSRPKVVFADEPTGNLDEKTSQEVATVMLDLSKHFGTAFVVVTHDKVLADKLDRVITLTEGKITI